MSVKYVEDIIESVTDIFEIKSLQKKVYCGILKRTISREEIIKTDILLWDNKSWKIIGVEAPAIPDPLRQGMSVGLLMVEIPVIYL